MLQKLLRPQALVSARSAWSLWGTSGNSPGVSAKSRKASGFVRPQALVSARSAWSLWGTSGQERVQVKASNIVLALGWNLAQGSEFVRCCRNYLSLRPQALVSARSAWSLWGTSGNSLGVSAKPRKASGFVRGCKNYLSLRPQALVSARSAWSLWGTSGNSPGVSAKSRKASGSHRGDSESFRELQGPPGASGNFRDPLGNSVGSRTESFKKPQGAPELENAKS